MSLFISSHVYASTTEIKPFIKESFKQIQQAHKNQPTIITFWSQSCAFCMKELALFGKTLKNYQNVELVSISTDPFLDNEVVNQILSSKNLQHVQKWVFADDYVERLYFNVDPTWRGELPLTYFLDKNNNLHKRLGVIKEAELINWLNKQNIASIK